MFREPNWTKKPSGTIFVSFLDILAEWRMEEPESFVFLCLSYIIFNIFFRLGIPRARISIVRRTRTGTESGGYVGGESERRRANERTIERERERREKKNHADEKQQLLTRHHSPLNSSSSRITI